MSPTPEVDALLLRNAAVPGQGLRDVLTARGQIVAVEPPDVLVPLDGAVVEDLTGYVLLPAGVEPHAHLDKAFLQDRHPNLTGDLSGAIDANRMAYACMDPEDISRRALRALQLAVRRGFTVVRSHVNVAEGLGLSAVRAVADVAARVGSTVDVELVALVACPVTGLEGRRHRRLLEQSLESGVAVVGGAPALDRRPDRAVDWLVRCAAEAGLPVDLHLDETLQADVMTVRTFARAVERHGLGGRATASHCVSLGQVGEPAARRIAVMLRDVGISVVVLPQTNLTLQGRDTLVNVPRATAPARLLREEGVRVVGGGDNWRDMFNPLGRVDPFETAALMAAVCQLPVAEAYAAVSTAAAAALGRRCTEVAPGSPAELLAVRAETLGEAVADASEQRTVIHRGRVVSRTMVTGGLTDNWPDM